MSCSPFDLKDYFLRELSGAEARQVEAHVRECAACAEELDRLRVTEAALFAIRDEEIPRRIAFVSDPVFEPSGFRRWFADFWGSAARLGFASAAMLSVAILVSALTRPAPAPAVPGAPVITASAPSLTAQEVQSQVQAAVEKAVRESEQRQAAKTAQLVSDFLAREREDNVRLARAADTIQYLERRNGALTMYAGGYRQASAGGPQ